MSWRHDATRPRPVAYRIELHSCAEHLELEQVGGSRRRTGTVRADRCPEPPIDVPIAQAGPSCGTKDRINVMSRRQLKSARVPAALASLHQSDPKTGDYQYCSGNLSLPLGRDASEPLPL